MGRAEVVQLQNLYDTVKKFFVLSSALTFPVLFLIDAPFGRFTPKAQNSIWLVDGIKAWMAMELVSPLSFSYAFLHSPLSFSNFGKAPDLSLSNPATIVASLFLIHYCNRAIVSPLRTPSRSKSHIIIPLSAVGYNVVNGATMGSYLSSPQAAHFLSGAFTRPLFWFGVGLWAFGFAGNILHDEILLNIRRKAKSKGKGKAKNDDDKNNGKDKQEHYAVPYGYLYSLISYPNYFCEWLEWIGFALAAAPLPSLASPLGSLTPPWIMVITEVFLMLPRAYKGHKWYHSRFPDYPKERKAVIPFVL